MCVVWTPEPLLSQQAPEYVLHSPLSPLPPPSPSPSPPSPLKVNHHKVGHDINVTGVWSDNITGVGVVVAVVDDGKDRNS